MRRAKAIRARLCPPDTVESKPAAPHGRRVPAQGGPAEPGDERIVPTEVGCSEVKYTPILKMVFL